MKQKAATLVMVLLVASVALPGVSRANIALTGGYDTREIVLLLFGITLVVEGSLILLAMGRRVASFLRLCLAIIGANVLSYAFLMAWFMAPLALPIDWFLAVGEIMVLVLEASLFGVMLRGRVSEGLWPIRAHPLLSLIAIVVVANLVTALLGVVLLAQ